MSFLCVSFRDNTDCTAVASAGFLKLLSVDTAFLCGIYNYRGVVGVNGWFPIILTTCSESLLVAFQFTRATATAMFDAKSAGHSWLRVVPQSGNFVQSFRVKWPLWSFFVIRSFIRVLLTRARGFGFSFFPRFCPFRIRNIQRRLWWRHLRLAFLFSFIDSNKTY